MWVLPSRSRPHSVRRLIEGFGGGSPVLLILDNDDPLLPAYLDLKYPANWSVVHDERAPLSVIYSRAFALFGDLDWYGFIADDVLPASPSWDSLLIEGAGRDGMAVPDDGSGDETHSPHFVLGGDLPRETGWLCLPGLNRIYIDTVWQDISRAKGVYRYLPDIKLTHLHFSTGHALLDSTYRKPEKAADRLLYQTWKANHEPHPAQ